MRVLAVGAHPDDIEFACAGTLAKCVQRGDSVVLAVVCNGDSASSSLPTEQMVRVRSEELHESAKALGAEDVIELGYSDYGIRPDPEALVRFTDVLRRARPDVVITHHFADYGGDHNNTHLVVLDATVSASVPNFKTSLPAIPKIPILYMMEPIGGFGFSPQVWVDITDTFEVKRRMLQCHRSQLEWMARYGGMDSLDYIETAAKFRGYQVGVKMAEGFIAHASFSHVPAGSVLP